VLARGGQPVGISPPVRLTEPYEIRICLHHDASPHPPHRCTARRLFRTLEALGYEAHQHGPNVITDAPEPLVRRLLAQRREDDIREATP